MMMWTLSIRIYNRQTTIKYGVPVYTNATLWICVIVHVHPIQTFTNLSRIFLVWVESAAAADTMHIYSLPLPPASLHTWALCLIIIHLCALYVQLISTFCSTRGLPLSLPRGRSVISHLKFGTTYSSILGFAVPYQPSNVISKHIYLWSPYVIGQTIIFSSCFFFLLLSSFFLFFLA